MLVCAGLMSAAQAYERDLDYMPPAQQGNEGGYANWLDNFCELSYEE